MVRVRPAYAGEGRYFVRVPPGETSEQPELASHEASSDAATQCLQIPFEHFDDTNHMANAAACMVHDDHASMSACIN